MKLTVDLFKGNFNTQPKSTFDFARGNLGRKLLYITNEQKCINIGHQVESFDYSHNNSPCLHHRMKKSIIESNNAKYFY